MREKGTMKLSLNIIRKYNIFNQLKKINFTPKIERRYQRSETYNRKYFFLNIKYIDLKLSTWEIFGASVATNRKCFLGERGTLALPSQYIAYISRAMVCEFKKGVPLQGLPLLQGVGMLRCMQPYPCKWRWYFHFSNLWHLGHYGGTLPSYHCIKALFFMSILWYLGAEIEMSCMWLVDVNRHLKYLELRMN